jgi:hypothetical protein
MTEVQKLGHEATVRSFGALHAAAAATESWTKNVIAPVFDGGAASCRAYGPLERDVANVYESTFVHRKQAVAEANGMVKVFEKRLERFEASLDHGVAQLSQAKQLGEAAKGKSGKIDSVNDGVKAACKKIQEMLECEVKCAEEREGKESSRREAAEEKKKAVLSEINGRRERIAQDVKDREAKRESGLPHPQCALARLLPLPCASHLLCSAHGTLLVPVPRCFKACSFGSCCVTCAVAASCSVPGAFKGGADRGLCLVEVVHGAAGETAMLHAP